MLLAALGAVYAAVASIGDVTSAGPSTQQVHAWRMVSFTMFVLINQASRAVANGVVDGILSVLLIAAYLLTRGYQATRAKA